MRVKERILTIRLMDKVNANPAAAEKLGIVIVKNSSGQRNAVSETDKG